MHPVDEALLGLPQDAGPEARLEAVWSAYEAAFNARLSRPPDTQDRRDVAKWLQSEFAYGNLMLLQKRALLARLLSITTHNKASYLQQQWCHECEPKALTDKDSLYHFTPINIDPWSAQSRRSKTNTDIKNRVRADLRSRVLPAIDATVRLCVCVVSLVPRAGRTKDVDNLVKGLLDSMTDVFWEDDSQVQCLTTRRIEYSGASGVYLTAVRAVHPWSDDVVWDDPRAPIVLSGSRLELR